MASLISIERARQNLRLDPDLWDQIDANRSTRPGNVSRNTWVTEAILEKLNREGKQKHVQESKRA